MRLHRCGIVLCVLAGCSPRLIVLQPQTSSAEQRQSPLHVIATVDNAADPLTLRGGNLAFGEVANTLGDVIASAATPWATKHQSQRDGGWELRVDLVQSRAEVSQGLVTIELAARVTLSATVGQVYLAQTHGYCRQTDKFEGDATRPVYVCMEAMAHDITGWLEGVTP
jgi:hypothetical protein